MKLPTPPIYVSYAWGQSAESEEEQVVNSLCKRLVSLRYKVVRDKDYLQYLDSLPDFLKRIGSGGYVIAIVGDKYLHSENCMIEASYMVQKGNLPMRVFPITLSSLKGIYNVESRSSLITQISDYWKGKENVLRKRLDEFHYPQGFLSMREDLSIVTQATNNLAEFIHHIGTTLQISSQHHLTENFKRLIEAVETSRTKDSEEFINLFGLSGDSRPYYKRFSSEYIGRKKNIEDVLNLLNDPQKHFMLLYGVGGMGKSHLIDICRREYNNSILIHEECTANYNLRSLFKTCGIRYPENSISTEERQSQFLKKFCEKQIYLILDDFYETIDSEIRGMLPKLASLPSGKLLLVSRAIPKELENIGFHYDKYFIPPLDERDFITVLKNYIVSEDKKVQLSSAQLHRIYEKAQGYPLGGQLIIDLLFLGETLEAILDGLPKFEAELDVEGKNFSGRLLDNIFGKGSPHEIDLLCQFSALFGPSDKSLIRQLPAFTQFAFDALVNRRKFIYRDDSGLFNSHAMIKDYAYDKLVNKEAIHQLLGKYFEQQLFANSNVDSKVLESAIQHYKRVGLNELKKFRYNLEREFDLNNVKSIIEKDVKDTIRNYKNLLVVYPEKMAYYTELGIAYRLNNQIDQAISTFLKATEKEPNNIVILHQLGIAYRERGHIKKAIQTFLKAEDLDKSNVKILNELGIAYRKSGESRLAIDTFLRAEGIEPNNVIILNELGITYRESGNFHRAIETFQKAIAIDKKSLQSYIGLAITYREAGKTQHAVDILLKAEKIAPNDVRRLNELAISYRESGNPDLAIETLKKAITNDPHHAAPFNELGITYREIGNYPEAIKICNDGLKIIPDYPLLLLNLLQIYVFFVPNKERAIEYFEKLSRPPRLATFKNNRWAIKSFIAHLDELLNLSIEEFKINDRYTYYAFLHRAYHTVLPLLLALNVKFPNNSRITGRLGKTLASKIIGKSQDGWKYLKETIELFNKDGDREHINGMIQYYLNSLLNNKAFSLLNSELIYFEENFKDNSAFQGFLGKYYEALGESDEKITCQYEKAIKVSDTREERIKSIGFYVDYLTRFDTKNSKVEELKLELDNLFEQGE